MSIEENSNIIGLSFFWRKSNGLSNTKPILAVENFNNQAYLCCVQCCVIPIGNNIYPSLPCCRRPGWCRRVSSAFLGQSSFVNQVVEHKNAGSQKHNSQSVALVKSTQ